MEVFKDYAYYYDMFYGDKDYSYEAKVVKSLIDRYRGGIKVSKVLNLGCGTGRHDFALAKLGYQMSGIDLSEEMIKVAESATGEGDIAPRFEVADIRSYESRQKYDAVISLFHVMSYQNQNEDILSAFKTAAKVLDTGRLFLFDVWYGPGVLSDPPSVRVKKVEDDENILIRYANPVMHAEDNIVDVCYNVIVVNKQTSVSKEIDEIHHMRYFFKPEIEFILDQAGFRLVACLDCKTLKETDYNSWTAYFIAIRK